MRKNYIHRALGLLLAGTMVFQLSLCPLASEIQPILEKAAQSEETQKTESPEQGQKMEPDKDTESVEKSGSGKDGEAFQETGNGNLAVESQDTEARRDAEASQEMGIGKGTEEPQGTDSEKDTETGQEAESGKVTETNQETDSEKDREETQEDSANDMENDQGADSAKNTENNREAGSGKDTESDQETDTEKDSGQEKDTDQKRSVSLSIAGPSGENYGIVWINPPSLVACQGRLKQVDYCDGVCKIIVPSGTNELRIKISHLSGIPENKTRAEVFFSKWGGYFTEKDGKWILYPEFLDGDTAVYGASELASGAYQKYTLSYENGTYVLPLERFKLSSEQFTVEQCAVYGEPEEQSSYAEICIGSFDDGGNREEKLLILVNFEDTEESGKDAGEGIEPETEAESGLETEPEPETEAESKIKPETADGSGLKTEPEPETEAIETAETFMTELLEDSAENGPQWNASPEEIADVYASTGQQLADSAQSYTPQVGSMNGEWQILGLARSGQPVDASVYGKYKANVLQALSESNGILHEKKYTEYSRVVLALTALGEDVTDVGGYNLLEPLADFDKTVWQGVNGAIFALIAFDSHNYEIPQAADGTTQNSRERLIQHILSQEIAGGGWDMSGKRADPDLTAMAIQSLAPYYESDASVKAAVDRGITMLSILQKADGSYASYGSKNAESCAQVIVALTALGIDPQTDQRFIKNGKTVMDGLLGFAMGDGTFAHTVESGANQMATEQAYYALAAYQRFTEGKTRLYDMTDVVIKSDREKAAEVEALIDQIPATVALKDSEIIKAALAYYNGLNSTQKSILDPDKVKKLQKAAADLKQLEAAQESEKKTETEKKEESGSGSSTKKPSGTTKAVNLVSGKTGGTSVTASAGKTSSVFIKEGQNENIENATLKERGKLSGVLVGVFVQAASTLEARAVVRKINRLFRSTKELEALPKEASDYTREQIDAAVETYKAYLQLTEQEQVSVRENCDFSQYEEAWKKIGEVNHYDAATGTDMKENQEEDLPWYIALSADPQLLTEEEEEKIRQVLGKDSELFGINEIRFMNLLDGEEWEPNHLVKVRLPMVDLEHSEYAFILHIKDDGTMEFLEGKISGSYIEFEAAEFSKYGIVGMNRTLEELLEEKHQNSLPVWGAVGFLASLLLLFLLWHRKTLENKER